MEPLYAPRPRAYASSGLARVHRLLTDANDESKKFFERLMDEWERAPYTLAETAFMEGARALGEDWIAVEFGEDRDNNPELRDDIQTAGKIFLRNEWLARFLHHLFRLYRTGARQPWTPDDVLSILESEMDDFNLKIDETRDILKDHPDAIAAELQELAEKRPDLLRRAPAAAPRA
jgi:hypothetical protein